MSQVNPKREKSENSSSKKQTRAKPEQNFWNSRIQADDIVCSFGHLDISAVKEILQIIGAGGRLVYVHPNKDLLAKIQRQMKNQLNLVLVDENFHKSMVQSESADVLISMSSMEFSSDAEAIVQEAKRILRPGGRIIAAEYDQHLLSHYPLAPHLEHQLQEIARDLKRQKLWDPYVGRKLYSLLNEAGFVELKALQLPAQIVTGSELESDMEEWDAWFLLLKDWKSSGEWQTTTDLEQFRQEFMIFFDNPDRFSYSPRIVLEGIREA